MKYKIIVKDYDNYYEKEIDTNDFEEKSVNVILDNEVYYMSKDFFKEHRSQVECVEIIKKEDKCNTIGMTQKQT